MTTLFEKLEYSALAQWVFTSVTGYSIMLTAHAAGLAIAVGLSGILCLRFLGLYRPLRLDALHDMFPLVWLGFLINLLSGGALFVSQATYFVTSAMFLLKFACIVLNACNLCYLQFAVGRYLLRAGGGPGLRIPDFRIKLSALCGLLLWAVAMTAGRLIAYF